MSSTPSEAKLRQQAKKAEKLARALKSNLARRKAQERAKETRG